MTLIRSTDYGETEKQLMQDPIIIAMKKELDGYSKFSKYLHESGQPTFIFMTRALNEYHDWGGTIPTHIGGPARAILNLRAQNAT